VTEEVTGETTSAPGGGDDVEVEAPFYHEGAPQAFQRLWTPHRMVYIGGQNKPSDDTPAQCPFCTGPQRGDEESLIVHRGQTSYVIMNLYPYNTGHLLVCPYRHISDWTEATPAERQEIGELTATAMSVVRSVSRPHGFNLSRRCGDRRPPPPAHRAALEGGCELHAHHRSDQARSPAARGAAGHARRRLGRPGRAERGLIPLASIDVLRQAEGRPCVLVHPVPSRPVS